LLLEAGARPAEPGEFTLRAFLNGKLDLTQAEAVMDLISAKTPLALRAAGEQLEGRLGTEINQLRHELLQAVAHLEAWIDFPEEGLGPEVVRSLEATIQAARQHVRRLLATAEEGRILREGIRLAICGAPNAGKSSLLNALLGMDRAIVSEQPGTTRDTIEEVANLHGFPFRIIDTAGLREGADAIEREGIHRTHRAVAAAEMVLEVVDATTGERVDLGPEAKGKPRVVVYNKSDLPSAREPAESGVLPISCHTGAGLDALIEQLLTAVRSPEGLLPGEGRESAAAINARHQSCLHRAAASLQTASEGLSAGLEPELIAIDLRAALATIGEVTGQADAEEILGEIFARFCIGK
jgi:tRNA modification GTPase